MNSKTLLLVGGSGFVGSKLGEKFSSLGWNIKLLTRSKRSFQYSYPCEEIIWDGMSIPAKVLNHVNVIINLAGQGIADKRWNNKYCRHILESRVFSTRAVYHAIQEAKVKPELVIQASAVGYYGLDDREDCDEQSKPGKDFLSDVCESWEKEAEKISKYTRLVIARIGVVLGWEGGALAKLWDIYASGLGAYLGNGRQWMNWIHIDDLTQFFEYALFKSEVSGVYNLVASQNTRNYDFHKILARHTPSFSFAGAPKISVQSILGARAKLLLTAPKVIPARLERLGFAFLYPDLESAMNSLLHERTHPHLHYLKCKQWVPCSSEEVWSFVSSAKNLERITPPWLNFKIVGLSDDEIQEGTKIRYTLKLHGIPFSWTSHISQWSPSDEFVDEQISGPYKVWFHRHVMRELSGGTLIEDRIEYKLPLYPFGELALPMVKGDLDKIFAFRKKATAKYLGDLD